MSNLTAPILLLDSITRCVSSPLQTALKDSSPSSTAGQIFKEQSHNRANSLGVRNKSKALYERISEPLFHLYLFFLGPQLDIQASVNKWLQLNVVYSKVCALIKTYFDPVLIDNSKDISDENCRPLEKAILCLLGRELQKHLKHCIEHSLLTERELKAAKETM